MCWVPAIGLTSLTGVSAASLSLGVGKFCLTAVLRQVRGMGASLDYFQFCSLLRFPALLVTTLEEHSGQ